MPTFQRASIVPINHPKDVNLSITAVNFAEGCLREALDQSEGRLCWKNKGLFRRMHGRNISNKDNHPARK